MTYDTSGFFLLFLVWESGGLSRNHAPAAPLSWRVEPPPLRILAAETRPGASETAFLRLDLVGVEIPGWGFYEKHLVTAFGNQAGMDRRASSFAALEDIGRPGN